MSKELLKARISHFKGHVCHISNQPLPDLVSLFDTHRDIPKAQGGTYTDKNTNLADPVAHMKAHGNYRERTQEMTNLKALFDDRSQTLKLVNKINNQLKAYKRNTDHPRQETLDFLNRQLKEMKAELAGHDRKVARFVRGMSDPLVQVALKVPGVGPITVGYCQVYIELAGVFPAYYPGTKTPHPRAGQEKAPHVSSLWSYVGLDKSNFDRYQKGVASGGNETLRTMLYTLADSQVRTEGPYAYLYYQTYVPEHFRWSEDYIRTLPKKQQERLLKRREKRPDLVGAYGKRDLDENLARSRDTKGNEIVVPWCQTMPSHRRGDALRKIIKHFLADYWFVGRTLYGLPTNPAYPEAQLGGGHRTVMPRERGWIY